MSEPAESCGVSGKAAPQDEFVEGVGAEFPDPALHGSERHRSGEFLLLSVIRRAMAGIDEGVVKRFVHRKLKVMHLWSEGLSDPASLESHASVHESSGKCAPRRNRKHRKQPFGLLGRLWRKSPLPGSGAPKEAHVLSEEVAGAMKRRGKRS